jgi:hypothetical protein
MILYFIIIIFSTFIVGLILPECKKRSKSRTSIEQTENENKNITINIVIHGNGLFIFNEKEYIIEELYDAEFSIPLSTDIIIEWKSYNNKPMTIYLKSLDNLIRFEKENVGIKGTVSFQIKDNDSCFIKTIRQWKF